MKPIHLKTTAFALALAASPLAMGQHKVLGGFAYGKQEAPTGKEWESVEELSLNKEYPRAYFFSFADEASATKVLPEHSSYWLSLNGDWQFHWSKTPDGRVKDFFKPDYNASSWDKLAVPSSWNVAGIQKDGSLKYGLPIYVNQKVIFQHKIEKDDWRGGVMREPPKTWTTYEYRNEVGQYRRTFEIPASWGGREVFIDFDGVDSFFYLWINGQYVGFSKNSRNTASFDISRYLKKGTNTVAVEVYRNSDGSFLEAQDMFRLPGIFRTVALRSTPKLQIYNLNVQGELSVSTGGASSSIEGGKEDLPSGEIVLNATLRNLTPKQAKQLHLNYKVYKCELYSDTVKEVAELKGSATVAVAAPNALTQSHLKILAKNIKAWSAEEPHRYVLVAQLTDKKGKVIETVSSYFGFTKVEIKDTPADKDEFGKAGRYFYVNGKPVKFKGVNRHESHPTVGHAITRAMMEEDVRLMKRANVNQVRLSHYPTDPYFFYLCDKYGLYVENEANLESHEYYYGEESLSHPKEWEKAHVARCVEMVEGSYNHPSIVLWSLGNEAGPGNNFVAAYKAVKAVDTTRPVQYERNNDIVDMGSNQYPSVGWVQGAASGEFDIKYPFHISEYAHSMGNAAGNLADYWKAIESSNFICGASVWDWVDQGIYNYTKDGTRYIAYGGDFGDYPNDGQFVMNGLLLADRTPKPQYYEIKKVYQNVTVSHKEGNTFEIFNKNYFKDLSDYNGAWLLYKDGKIVDTGSFSPEGVAPRSKKTITIPALASLMSDKGEYFIIFEFLHKKKQLWAEEGYIQMEEQLPLKNDPAKQPIASVAKGKKLTLSKTPKEIRLHNDAIDIRFNPTTGNIAELSYAGKALLEPNSFELNAFRAFINNDGWALHQWFEKGLHNLHHKAIASKVEADKPVKGAYTVAFTVESQAPNPAQLKGSTSAAVNTIEELPIPEHWRPFKLITAQNFTVYPDGSVEIAAAITSNDNSVTLPDLGYIMKLPKTYYEFTYYGRGPECNYPDRKTSAFVDIHRNSVKDEVIALPKPQDMGQHQDTRWAALTDASRAGAVFIAPELMATAALPYSATELIYAGHPYQLPTSSGTYLQLNIATTGVGGNSCGPAPLNQDRVMAMPHHFRCVIRPAKADKLAESAAVVASSPLPATPQLLGKDKPVPIKVIFASSEESGEGDAAHLVDGNPNTIWHTAYSVTVAKHPHWVDFDLMKPMTIKGFSYLPRLSGYGGEVKDYTISVSDDGKTWREIHKGSFGRNRNTAKEAYFKAPVKTRYIRFTALNEQYGQDFASGAEFSVIPQ